MAAHLKNLLKNLRSKLGPSYHRWRKVYYRPFRERILSLIGREGYYKFKRKAISLFEQKLKYNSKYKPKGVYRTCKEYRAANSVAEVEYFEIYPALISSLPMAPELYQACSDYAKPNLEVKTDYVVVKIPKGRIYTNNMGSIAVIADDNKMIGDISLQYKNGKIVEPKENYIFQQNYFTPPEYFPGTVFTMLSGGGAINNYGHWLMDALPRLHLLEKSGMMNSVDWFLVPSLRYDYQRDSLKILGIPEHKIIEGDKLRHISADYIVASTAPRGDHAIIPDWVFHFLRSNFTFKAKNERSFPPYIHISRKDSKFRNVLNEDDLVEMITPYGFETITLSQLSFIEKIELFANAEVILGASGAGLTNIFFSNPGTKFIELFSDGFVLTDYIDIAHKAGLDYHYVISKALSPIRSKRQGQRDHLVIDLKNLQKVLDKVMVKVSGQGSPLV